METPAERLKWARLQRFPDSEATEMARKFGWSIHTYGGHERGDRNISLKRAAVYGRAYGVRKEWLLFGTGKITTHAHGARPDSDVSALVRIDSQRVPRLVWGMINDAKSITVALQRPDALIDVPNGTPFGENAFALVVADDAMVDEANPYFGFLPGQTVVFDPDKECRPGNFVLASVDGETDELFRQYRRAGKDSDGRDQIDLVPLNPYIESKRITPNVNGKLLAKLVYHGRTF
jgi:SOS-response transcriptional repressor LexA